MPHRMWKAVIPSMDMVVMKFSLEKSRSRSSPQHKNDGSTLKSSLFSSHCELKIVMTADRLHDRALNDSHLSGPCKPLCFDGQLQSFPTRKLGSCISQLSTHDEPTEPQPTLLSNRIAFAAGVEMWFHK